MSDHSPSGPQFDHAACGLMQTTETGEITWVNQTFCDWVGRGKDMLLTMNLQDLLSMGGRIFYQTHWDPLLRMQGSVSEVKIQVRAQFGSVIPMVMNAVRRTESGHVHNDLALFVARDRDLYERELVTSRKDLQAALAESQRLQALADGQAAFAEQMVGIVSHDLRNPLSTIMMGVALLTRGEVTAKQLTMLGRIARAAERSNRLISDLLDFTQARLGRGVGITPKEVNLKSVVTEAVDELRLAFPDSTLLHRHEGEGSVMLDTDRLAQLLGNLVGNAVAYGASDAAITISSSMRGGEAIVEVHNHGPAIPADRHAAMFEPMVRGAGASTGKRSVGLGLFIVGEIVRAHGGRIEVISEDGVGTTFRTHLPRP